MPNDAKFGLVVGMILVLLIALLFIRKEGTGELPAAPPAPAKVAPKIVVPRIEPPPKIAPPPVSEETPELPPPAFEAPAVPPPSFTKK